MLTLSLARGVEFDEDKHEYWYKGKRLSGVTGLISKKLGLKMPQEFVEEHRMEGIHVHKAVQKWIETGDPDSVHPGVKWLIETWDESSMPATACSFSLYSEVLVTDFEQYASAVDIVNVLTDGSLILYDIKKGLFKREYVSYQLNTYRYFIEHFTQRKVFQMVCICLRDNEYYPVFRMEDGRIEELLYRKKKKHSFG
jgi:hypothetical protein